MTSNRSAVATDIEKLESKVVKDYLDGLERRKVKRGRKRSPDTIKRRLAQIEMKLPSAPSLTKLHLIQEKLDLENTLKEMNKPQESDDLEPRFIEVAKSYSERNKISYNAWRAIGVRPEVLRKAGILDSTN
jgi:hypothetical protein